MESIEATAVEQPESAPRKPRDIAWKMAAVVLAGFLVAGAVALLAGGGGSSRHPHLIGTLTLTDPDAYVSHNEPCQGTGGYDHIQEGAQVVVSDGQGKILATTSLSSGSGGSDENCIFSFVVKDLPTADFYSVEVSHRGKITSSRQELEKNAWWVRLTLGS